jgi:two-component system response regulator PilR (NtrC family)
MSGQPLQDALDALERERIVAALDATRWVKTHAAELLGVTFRSLRYRMDRLQITRAKYVLVTERTGARHD